MSTKFWQKFNCGLTAYDYDAVRNMNAKQLEDLESYLASQTALYLAAVRAGNVTRDVDANGL